MEQFIDVPVPQITVKHIPQERVQNFTVEQIVALSVPWIRRVVGQMLILRDRISDRNGEQIADVPVPQVQEKLVEEIQLIQQERIHNRVTEQVIDNPVEGHASRAFATRHRRANRGRANSFDSSGNWRQPIPQGRISLNYQDCEVLFHINKQNLDIARDADVNKDDLDAEAGNQNVTLGCTTDDTEDVSLLTGLMATRLEKNLVNVPVVMQRAAAAQDRSIQKTTSHNNQQSRQCKTEKKAKEKRGRKVEKKERREERMNEKRKRKKGNLRKQSTRRPRRT